jgi:hypothetical protein
VADHGTQDRHGLVEPARLEVLDRERQGGVVPEYVASAPMLPPALTPLTTMSGTGQRTPRSAMRTQSDGMPSHARPSKRPPKVRRFSSRGRRTVMPRATALVLRSGAMVVTSPRPRSARRSTAIPGAAMPSSLVRRICKATRGF